MNTWYMIDPVNWHNIDLDKEINKIKESMDGLSINYCNIDSETIDEYIASFSEIQKNMFQEIIKGYIDHNNLTTTIYGINDCYDYDNDNNLDGQIELLKKYVYCFWISCNNIGQQFKKYWLEIIETVKLSTGKNINKIYNNAEIDKIYREITEDCDILKMSNALNESIDKFVVSLVPFRYNHNIKCIHEGCTENQHRQNFCSLHLLNTSSRTINKEIRKQFMHSILHNNMSCFIMALNHCHKKIMTITISRNLYKLCYTDNSKKSVIYKQPSDFMTSILMSVNNTSFYKKIKNCASFTEKIKYIILFYKTKEDSVYTKKLIDDIHAWNNMTSDTIDYNPEFLIEKYRSKMSINNEHAYLGNLCYEYKNIKQVLAKIIKSNKKSVLYNYKINMSSCIEQVIWLYLTDLTRQLDYLIYIKREKSFSRLKNKSYLRYDFFGIVHCNKNFYIPFVIEYDGGYHWYDMTRGKRLLTSRESTNTSDIIKDFFVWENGIALLRLCYRDISDIAIFKKYIYDFINDLHTGLIPIHRYINTEAYNDRNIYLENLYNKKSIKDS